MSVSNVRTLNNPCTFDYKTWGLGGRGQLDVDFAGSFVRRRYRFPIGCVGGNLNLKYTSGSTWVTPDTDTLPEVPLVDDPDPGVAYIPVYGEMSAVGQAPSSVTVRIRREDNDDIVAVYTNRTFWQPHMPLPMFLYDYDTSYTGTMRWNRYGMLMPSRREATCVSAEPAITIDMLFWKPPTIQVGIQVETSPGVFEEQIVATLKTDPVPMEPFGGFDTFEEMTAEWGELAALGGSTDCSFHGRAYFPVAAETPVGEPTPLGSDPSVLVQVMLVGWLIYVRAEELVFFERSLETGGSEGLWGAHYKNYDQNGVLLDEYYTNTIGHYLVSTMENSGTNACPVYDGSDSYYDFGYPSSPCNPGPITEAEPFVVTPVINGALHPDFPCTWQGPAPPLTQCGGSSLWKLLRTCNDGDSWIYYWLLLDHSCYGRCDADYCVPSVPFDVGTDPVDDTTAAMLGWIDLLEEDSIEGDCGCGDLGDYPVPDCEVCDCASETADRQFVISGVGEPADGTYTLSKTTDPPCSGDCCWYGLDEEALADATLSWNGTTWTMVLNTPVYGSATYEYATTQCPATMEMARITPSDDLPLTITVNVL